LGLRLQSPSNFADLSAELLSEMFELVPSSSGKKPCNSGERKYLEGYREKLLTLIQIVQLLVQKASRLHQIRPRAHSNLQEFKASSPDPHAKETKSLKTWVAMGFFHQYPDPLGEQMMKFST